MKETITVTGMVISTMPLAEYDKRLLLLTRELGKISAFSKGVRRPMSPLMASARLFAFGEFELYEGRSAYTVREFRLKESFDFLSEDMEAMCFASYFAEFADYYGREGIDGSGALLLLYAALRALRSDRMPRDLIRAVYELKAMALEGEYVPSVSSRGEPAAEYAWQYVLKESPGRVFSFGLDERPMKVFLEEVQKQKDQYIDRPFRSLEVLEETRRLLQPDTKKTTV